MPVDVSEQLFDLRVQTASGAVSVPFNALAYEDDPNEIGMKVRISAPAEAVDEWDPSILANGAAFVFSGGPPDAPRNICRGVILGLSVGLTAGLPLQPRGYSLEYAMLHSRIDCHYNNGETGVMVMADLCTQWGIPIDTLDGPNTVVAPLTGRRKQIADIFKEILTRAKAAGDGSYVIKWGDNGLKCVRPGGNATVYCFTEGESILGGTIDSSAESIVTRVRVIEPVSDKADVTIQRDSHGRFISLQGGKSIKVPREVASVDGHTEFGVFQDIIYAKKDTDPQAALAMGQAKLQVAGQPATTIELECPLLADIEKGDRHHIIGGPIDTYGYVLGLSGDVASRQMRLTMAIEWTDSFSTADTDTQDDSGVADTSAAVTGNANTPGYNADTPPVYQTTGWTCSASSAAWMLQSMGIDASEQDVITALGAGINSSVGLTDGSGAHLAAALRTKWGVNAVSSPVTYDQILESAGSQPIQVGSSTWDHWTGVAARDGDDLVLANPAKNYGGTTMTRAQWNARAPWYAVRIDPTAGTAS